MLVLTISSGHSAAYLTEAVTTGRENYYTGAVAAGEPPGRWYGAGAASLGLAGVVDPQDMTALYERFLDPRDPNFGNPQAWDEAETLGHTGRKYTSAEEVYAQLLAAEPDASPERQTQLRVTADKKARSNVSFLDATFSVQKSVTLLHAAFEAQRVAAEQDGQVEAAAAWAEHVKAVEHAIWAGNNAGLDYLAGHAGYSRVGHHGGHAGRFVDGHAWTIASFFQHDNRDHEPQLHVHNAIFNRVQGPDGVWRTLDSRAIHRYRGAAGAVAERTIEEYLTATLGVRFATRPDGKAREILGIDPGVLDLFSGRRRAITGKTAQLAAEFEAEFGRAPNALERDRLSRQATFATRRAKSHVGETASERLRRWDAQLRDEVGDGLTQLARQVLGLHQEQPPTPTFSPSQVMAIAVAEVQETKAAWNRADLARAISDALPDHLGGLDGGQVARLIDGLADEAVHLHGIQLTDDGPASGSLPKGLKLADGRSAYDPAAGRLYATAEQLAAEQTLEDAGRVRDAARLGPDAAREFVEQLRGEGIELGADQAAAVTGILTSGARVEALVGPAGTGKSFVLGALARAWTGQGVGRVVGLATSQVATEVLAGEGLQASNIARWLNTQQRLDSDHARDHDAHWQLTDGDLVVIDESAMTDTTALTTIHDRVQAAGAKLLLCGDHRQLAAVGAGGGMALVAQAAPTYELAEARRFDQEWERDASLRLRAGDPDVLVEYRKHGRIIDGRTPEATEDRAVAAYLADLLAGRQTLLVVDTNDQAARVCAKVRAELVRLGRVTETGATLGLDGSVAGTGDLVQARHNEWNLAGQHGNRRGPLNRETYEVREVGDDGSLTVTTGTGPDDPGEAIWLPPDYVAEQLTLGYASTSYAIQGATADTCHTIAGPATSRPGLYVGMSRGRAANTCYVTTTPSPADTDDRPVQDTERRDPVAVLSERFDAEREQLAAVAEATQAADEAMTVRPPAERFADVAALATAGRTATGLDRLVDTGAITAEQHSAIVADGTSALDQMLRRAEVAGHNPQQILRQAIQGRSLAGARNPGNVLAHRIRETTSLDPAGDSYADWTPHVDDPDWQTHLADLAAQADQRRVDLGLQTAAEQPAWAVQAFGSPPEEPDQLADWTRRAGAVAAHRELASIDDEDVALPAPPKPGQVEAYASWRAAWRALGRPEAGRAEAEMSDGQLLARIRAHDREKTWAPAYVAPELSGVAQAEQWHRDTARLRTAEAEGATDEEERARLQRESADAEELADQLAHQRAQLTEADQARGLWYAHTAATRLAADRARAELAARGTDRGTATDPANPGDWLAEHRADQAAGDEHRPILDDHDLADLATERDTDTEVFVDRQHDAGEPEPEPAAADIRHQTRDETPPVSSHDWERVPATDATTGALARAQRALDELQQRQALDTQRHADRHLEDEHLQAARHRPVAVPDQQAHDREVVA